MSATAIYWRAAIEPHFFARSMLASTWSDLQNPPLIISLRTNVPGLKPWLGVLHLLTGLEVGELPRLAVGAIGRGILYFALVYALHGRFDIATIAGLVMVIYPWAGWNYSNVFVHGVGGILFLTFILVIIADVRTGSDRRMFGMAVVLFAGLHLLDYTAHVWTVAFLAVLAVGAIVFRWSVLRQYFVLAAIGAVLFFQKRTVDAFASLFVDFNLLGPLVGYFQPAPTHGYEYTGGSSGLGLSTGFFLLVLILIGIYGTLVTWSTIRDRTLEVTSAELVIGAVFIGGVGGTLLYTLMDRFSQFFIFLCFPLISIAALHFLMARVPSLTWQKTRVSRSQVMAVFLCVLLVLAGAEWIALMATGDIDPESDARAEPAGEWIYEHSTAEPEIQSDLATIGRIRMPEERADANANYQHYSPDQYSSLVTGGSVETEYTIADYDSEAGVRATGGWARYESLQNHQDIIESNQGLTRAYSTDGVAIYRSQTNS